MMQKLPKKLLGTTPKLRKGGVIRIMPTIAPPEDLPMMKKGGQVKVKSGKKKALVILHDGELVIPKKQVGKVKKEMKSKGLVIPKTKKMKGL